MAQRIQQAGQTHAMELIFFPLIILILVGLIANTFQSSAIQTVPVLPTPFCTGNIEPGECYPVNVNGCDASASANCNFTAKTTFSFLNPNSPFTLLLQGNVIGFIASALSGGETLNIITSGFATCIPLIHGVFKNESGTDINNFQCQSFAIIGNATFTPVFPTTGVPLNLTSNNGNNSDWSGTGCLGQPNQGPSHIFGYPCFLNYGNGVASFNGTTSPVSFYGFYVKNGTSFAKSSTCNIFGSGASCLSQLPYLYHASPTFTCPSTHLVAGININATTYYCFLPVNNPITSTNSLPNAFSGLSFLFGAILLFIGLGLAITSALIGFSINEQGTKIAQVMGIGILTWSFVYGEFGQWLNSLPFNLGTITFTIFTMMFFLGLYWRLFSFD